LASLPYASIFGASNLRPQQKAAIYLHLMVDDDIEFKNDILEDGGIRLDF
jgi:hypothetical protein